MKIKCDMLTEMEIRLAVCYLLGIVTHFGLNW